MGGTVKRCDRGRSDGIRAFSAVAEMSAETVGFHVPATGKSNCRKSDGRNRHILSVVYRTEVFVETGCQRCA